MPQSMDVWIQGGPDQALRRLRFGLGQALVNARDHHVQLREQFIRKIELAVLQNVHFGTG